MAKPDTLHKNFHEIKVIMTNNEEFTTRSTYNSDTLKLDIDCKTHPAWTNQAGYINTRASKVSEFNKRYAGLGFMSHKNTSEDTAEDNTENK